MISPTRHERINRMEKEQAERITTNLIIDALRKSGYSPRINEEGSCVGLLAPSKVCILVMNIHERIVEHLVKTNA